MSCALAEMRAEISHLLRTWTFHGDNKTHVDRIVHTSFPTFQRSAFAGSVFTRNFPDRVLYGVGHLVVEDAKVYPRSGTPHRFLK